MPFRVRSALPLATEGTQECLWNLAYDERRMAIVLELTVSLEEEAISDLCCQFPIPADYTGKVQRAQSSYSTYEKGNLI